MKAKGNFNFYNSETGNLLLNIFIGVGIFTIVYFVISLVVGYGIFS